MKNLFPLCFILLFLSSCISNRTYLDSLAAGQQTRDSLQTILNETTLQRDTIREALLFERGSTHALFLTQDKLQDRLDILQEEIDRQGSKASSTQENLTAKLQQKDDEIAARQRQLDGLAGLLQTRIDRLSTLERELVALLPGSASKGWESRLSSGQLLVSINENSLFRKGSTSSITSEGKELLNQIAAVTLRYPEMQVTVIGHTDNQPIARQSLDNWQYSALRAVSVVEYLTQEKNLGPNRTLAASKSEFSPLESNETEAGRARNRRVDIVISPLEADLQREMRAILER
jgi:chemotaxis protein MotB